MLSLLFPQTKVFSKEKHDKALDSVERRLLRVAAKERGQLTVVLGTKQKKEKPLGKKRKGGEAPAAGKKTRK